MHRGADSLESAEKAMTLSPPTSFVCCVPAPAVMEFDSAGRVLSYWGGPGEGFVWPQSTGGIAVDGGAVVTVTNCAISNNSVAKNSGGGIFCDTSTLTVTGSTLSMWEVVSVARYPGEPLLHVQLARVGAPNDRKTVALRVLRDKRYYQLVR